MQFLSSIIACLLLLITSVFADNGGWFNSCGTWGDYQLVNGHTLIAQCPAFNGAVQSTSVDLNPCLMNRCGNLVGDQLAPGGDFDATCYSCGLTYNTWNSLTSTLQCLCRDCNGNYVFTQVDTNSFVSNINGNLQC